MGDEASMTASATEWDGLPTPRRYWSVAAIWLALSMAVLDAAIANVALPAIARDLHAAAAESIWVVNAYQLAIVVSLLPLAALGEIVGYRNVFQGGLVLFVLASIGCTFSHTLAGLAAARAVQGLGAAGVMSVNGALVRFTYPQRLLGRGIGLNALVISVASVVGPSIASAILAVAGWQWLFAVNVPMGLLAIGFARFALPESPRSGRRLDWIAAALNVLTFGLIIGGVDILTRGSGSWIGAVEMAGGVLAAVMLVRRSIGQPRPLAPIDLLRSRSFSLTVLTSIASFSAQTLAFVALPFYFQDVLHRTQVETGVLMTPWPLAVGVAAPLAGRLADRYAAAVLCGVGLAVMTVGLILLAVLPDHASMLDIGWRMAVCGAGFGFFQAPNNRAMLSAAPMERSGAAGGMLATARLTGQTIGATLTAILFRAVAAGPVSALASGAVFAAIGALVSVSRLLEGRRRSGEDSPPA
jgi:DHA2 family multidrug resistance protein-like MFS transporter